MENVHLFYCRKIISKMITITSSILFLAFYALYYTSKRVPLSYTLSFEKWMQKNQKSTKISGIILLITAYFLWIYTTGLGVGTLLFAIELMTIGSLIILLKPLKFIGIKSLFFLFIIIEFFEIYYA